MNRSRNTLMALIAGAGLTAALVGPALASSGPVSTGRAGPAAAPVTGPAVVVFSLEGSQLEFQGTRLAIFSDPSGCYALPPGAHVIDNLTNAAITLYADPVCWTPVSPPFGRIEPGFGAHVSPFGSFRAP